MSDCVSQLNGGLGSPRSLPAIARTEKYYNLRHRDLARARWTQKSIHPETANCP